MDDGATGPGWHFPFDEAVDMERRGESDRFRTEERTVPPREEILSRNRYDAVILEVDGVVTNTVDLHFEAWQHAFDALLRTIGGRRFQPFNREEFRQFVDGKPRREAIESFLDARGITRPLGEPLPEADEALTHDTDSVYGLSKMKRDQFVQSIESGRLRADDDAVDFVHQLVRAGFKVAAVSPSEHTRRVLSILDLAPLFDEVVDATTFEEQHLSGKPASDVFMEATTELAIPRDRVVVVESDRPSIEAGRAAGFGLIVVVAKDGAEKKKFLRRGADLAVERLDALHVKETEQP